MHTKGDTRVTGWNKGKTGGKSIRDDFDKLFHHTAAVTNKTTSLLGVIVFSCVMVTMGMKDD